MNDLIEAVTQAVTRNTDLLVYHGWSLKKLYGGMNSIAFYAHHAAVSGSPFAVKIRKKDERQRATREFAALEALRPLSPPVAPEPISLHTNIDALPGDMIVSGWIEGRVLGNLSDASSDVWESILLTLSRIHSLKSDAALVNAVWAIYAVENVIQEIEKRYDRLVEGQTGTISKADIGKLFAKFKKQARSQKSPAQPPHAGLILCDTNPSNMIERDGRILIVDWENAGLSDTAFDIADLLVRPECASLTPDRHQWILTRYAELMGLPGIGERVLMYERLMLVFWLILTTNGFSAQQTPRLAGARQFTHEETRNQQLAYLERIERAFSG